MFIHRFISNTQLNHYQSNSLSDNIDILILQVYHIVYSLFHTDMFGKDTIQ